MTLEECENVCVNKWVCVRDKEREREDLKGFARGDDVGEAKVNQLQAAVALADQNVLWLEVSVNYLERKKS